MALEEALAVLGGGLGAGLVEPEVEVCLVEAQGGVGEGRLAVHGQAADVIGVRVRDVDLVDLVRRVSRGLEIGGDVAQRGAEEAAGAGVDEHQLAAGVDEISVVGGLDRVAKEGLLQRGGGRAGLVLQQLGHRELGRAVGEGRDLERPDHEAEVARGLGLRHGGAGARGEREGGREQRRGGEEAG
jgi:hypothetical protein